MDGQEEFAVVKSADEDEGQIDTVCEIVSAYVSNNTLPAVELTKLIQEVHTAVSSLSPKSAAALNRQTEKAIPAVPVSQSVQTDHMVCLECGMKYKSLRKHLRTTHDLSPEEYIAKWELPDDYPMVCPDYAKHRSNLAKKIGLGKR